MSLLKKKYGFACVGIKERKGDLRGTGLNPLLISYSDLVRREKEFLYFHSYLNCSFSIKE